MPTAPPPSRAILADAIPPHWNLPFDPEFVGIYIGGCVSAAPMSYFYGHTHCRRKGLEPYGWICIRDHSNVVTDAGMPSQTLLHEYAHLLTDEAHTVAWANVLILLGGTVDPRYTGLPFI